MKKKYLVVLFIITLLLTGCGNSNQEESFKDKEIKSLSDIYSKYKDDIKYLGINYTILKDNNVISTDVFYASLDK